MVSIFSGKNPVYLWMIVELTLIVVFSSCNNQNRNNQNTKVFNDIIKIAKIQDDPDVLVVVPKYICLECNTHIFLYCRQIIASHNKVKILFLNKQDYVEKFLPESKNSPSIIFIPFQDSLAIKYPTVLRLENNAIKKIEYQCIENPYALNRLIKK